MPTHALSMLAALEARYDGPIPEPLRRTVGASAPRTLAEAEGQARFFAALVRWQIDAIRRTRRAGGAVPERLFADLTLYRRQQCWWRREAKRCRAGVTPSAADVP